MTPKNIKYRPSDYVTNDKVLYLFAINGPTGTPNRPGNVPMVPPSHLGNVFLQIWMTLRKHNCLLHFGHLRTVRNQKRVSCKVNQRLSIWESALGEPRRAINNTCEGTYYYYESPTISKLPKPLETAVKLSFPTTFRHNLDQIVSQMALK